MDFSEDRAEITRRDGNIETVLEVVVSPEDDAEIRRVTLKNTGSSPRLIDVTSYAEMVLAPHAADLAHPAFSNLFVQTEFVPEVNGLLCTRRPRSLNELSAWAATQSIRHRHIQALLSEARLWRWRLGVPSRVSDRHN